MEAVVDPVAPGASEEVEESLSPLDLPAAPPHPQETLEIDLDDVAELENSRPAYYGIEELRNSLHTQGQLEPCLVRPAHDDKHGRPYELVFGYRRKRAAEELGWTTLRCEVRDIPTDSELLERQISENFQRENMSPIAEANAMRRMMKIGDLTQAEVARRLGVDPSQVSHRLKLLGLKEDILTRVDEGKISASTAEVISSLSDPDAQGKIADMAERNDWGLKKVQKWVREYKAGENRDRQDLEALEAQELGQTNPQLLVQMEDVVELPRLAPREDMTADEFAQLVLYQQLRLGNDNEMLAYLEEEMGTPYERLWDYVSSLDASQVQELSRRMALRFLSSPHRYRTFEEGVKDSLCLGTQEEWDGTDG
jgi:ParB/RepB/Spo0J family partition protein